MNLCGFCQQYEWTGVWDKGTGLRVMYLCRMGGAHNVYSVHSWVVGAMSRVGSPVGAVGTLGSLVGGTCGEDQRDAVPGSIHKLWVTLGYQLLG